LYADSELQGFGATGSGLLAAKADLKVGLYPGDLVGRLEVDLEAVECG